MKLWALLVGAFLLAQTPARRTASPRLTFDVVAIHPSDPNAIFGRIKPIPGNHGYTAENVPVRLMIALMYKIPSRQIEGGPSWLNTDRFDVEARADAPHSLAPADSLPPEERDLPTVFDALRTQLGLRLTATRGPVDHFVIDQVEKPTAN